MQPKLLVAQESRRVGGQGEAGLVEHRVVVVVVALHHGQQQVTWSRGGRQVGRRQTEAGAGHAGRGRQGEGQGEGELRAGAGPLVHRRRTPRLALHAVRWQRYGPHDGGRAGRRVVRDGQQLLVAGLVVAGPHGQRVPEVQWRRYRVLL